KAKERILGAMGFGGAAWKVAPRDIFLGWTPEERESRLHLIVNQTRFLILPWIRCQNLATKSLALARHRIGDDWEQRYGYRPVLLETFVDTTRFRGTCYKADNWIHVGFTQGRSRMDRYHANDQPVKSIWLLPLQSDFRKHLSDRRME
ncbi:MAG: Druantia anti-phage system protein DruA, partial [Patescibacteria group bacterium]